MKAKDIRGAGFRGVLNYVFREVRGIRTEHVEIVAGNMAGIAPRQLAAEFAAVRRLRPDIKKPVFHCPVSLPPGELLDAEKWAVVLADLMKEIEFSDAFQWVAGQHTETHCQHAHIIASRIGLDGSIWYGRHGARKLIDACQRIEERHGLRLTMGLKARPGEMPADSDTLKPKRDRIVKTNLRRERAGEAPLNARAIAFVARDALRSAASVDELRATLAARGIEIELTRRGHDVDGEVCGWKLAGLSASTLDRSLGWGQVAKRLSTNQDSRERAHQAAATKVVTAHQQVRNHAHRDPRSRQGSPQPARHRTSPRHLLPIGLLGKVAPLGYQTSRSTPTTECAAPIARADAQAAGTQFPVRITDTGLTAETTAPAAEAARAELDAELRQLPRRQLLDLRLAVLCPASYVDQAQALVRRLLALVMRVLTGGALRVAGSAQEREVPVRRQLLAEIDAELARRVHTQTEQPSPATRIVKSHDARLPIPVKPDADGVQNPYHYDRGG